MPMLKHVECGVVLAALLSPVSLAAPVVVTRPAPMIEVLDPGAEPRAPLRYRLTAGDEHAAEMRADLRVEQQAGALAPPQPPTVVPTTIQIIETRVENVRLDGEARVIGRITDAWLADPAEGENPLVRAALEEGIGGIVGLRVAMSMTDRGVMLRYEFDGPEGLDEEVRGFLDSLGQSMDQLSTPLPVDPVGVGARWRVVSEAVLNGVPTRLERIVTLTRRAGDRVELAAETAVSLPGGKPVTPEGAPPGIGVTVEVMEGTGRGVATLDLTRALPLDARADSRVTNTVSVDTGQGDPVRVTTTMRIAMSIVAAPPEPE